MTTKKSETGKKPGNQTPDTPDINESEMRRHDWKDEDTARIPGNQTPDTPGRNESDRR
jgi:hypothetical protein